MGYELTTLDVDNLTIYITCNKFPLLNKVILEEFTKALIFAHETQKILIIVLSLFDKPKPYLTIKQYWNQHSVILIHVTHYIYIYFLACAE